MDATPLISVRLVETADRVGRGWPIGSTFVEEFWLPILGPSAVALLRWFDRRADHYRRITTLNVADIAVAIGLGDATSKHSPIVRTVERLVRFDAARWDAPDASMPELAIYTHLFAVPTRLTVRLPEPLQAEHRRTLAALAGLVR